MYLGQCVVILSVTIISRQGKKNNAAIPDVDGGVVFFVWSLFLFSEYLIHPIGVCIRALAVFIYNGKAQIRTILV